MRKTGLTPRTVSKRVEQLLKDGLIINRIDSVARKARYRLAQSEPILFRYVSSIKHDLDRSTTKRVSVSASEVSVRPIRREKGRFAGAAVSPPLPRILPRIAGIKKLQSWEPPTMLEIADVVQDLSRKKMSAERIIHTARERLRDPVVLNQLRKPVYPVTLTKRQRHELEDYVNENTITSVEPMNGSMPNRPSHKTSLNAAKTDGLPPCTYCGVDWNQPCRQGCNCRLCKSVSSLPLVSLSDRG